MRVNPFMEFSSCQIMPSLQSPLTADLFMSPLTAAPRSTSQKKYLVCCLICGSFSFLLGAMFFGVYYLIRSYTLNGYFETVPTYVPATLLIVTGMCILSFAKRRNRYSCMIYFSGISSAVSAVTCAAVTVTTKILHMSRLQDLNLNCEYKITTRICTCYSHYENQQDDGRKFLFDAVDDCRVAQGDLYSCLQAIFGLSIAGVLVAVFCCMLSYLLFSHERKKLYWEQLDMRFRLLHASHYNGQPPSINSHYHHHNNCHHQLQSNDLRGNNRVCGYCEHCHVQATATAGYPYTHMPANIIASQYPWRDSYGVADENKFLTIAGQHEYGNFFRPNLNRLDVNCMSGSSDTENNNNNNELSQNNGNGWRWPRMPWQRNLDLNSFQHARLSSRNNNNNTSDFQGWNGFMGPPQYIGGYPIGIWGPPPPPYSDLNNGDWNISGESAQINNNNNDNINIYNNINNNSNSNNNNSNNSAPSQSIQCLENRQSTVTSPINNQVEITSIPETSNK